MIPDHIIEKAAKAKFHRAHPEYPEDANDWEWTVDQYRQVFRDSVTRTLDSVYADIQAEALREAALAYQLGGWANSMPRSSDRPALILGMAQQAIDWFRVRADELDDGKGAMRDPLDEDDHSDRRNRKGVRLVRADCGRWHGQVGPRHDATCIFPEDHDSLFGWSMTRGPITFDDELDGGTP